MFAASTTSGLGFQTQSLSSPFVSENNFANVFGQTEPVPGISPLTTTVPGLTAGVPTAGSKLVTGDLDSSLANLASNLNFGPAGNRGFAAAPARGPPMANATGFNPFPQQQQQMAHPFM